MANVFETRRSIPCPSPTDKAVLDPGEEIIPVKVQEAVRDLVPDGQAACDIAADVQASSLPTPVPLHAAVVPSLDEQNPNVSAQSDLAHHLHVEAGQQQQLDDIHQVVFPPETLVKKRSEESMVKQEKDRCAVAERRRALVKAVLFLCMWKKVLAKQLQLYTLETPAGSLSGNISATSKCLNDSSRAYMFKLGVVSSLATSLDVARALLASVSVFPAWPPGVFEL